MITVKRMTELCECFPKANIANPNFYSSCFFDTNYKIIGWLCFKTGTFVLNENYENYALAKKVLDRVHVKYDIKKLDAAELLYKDPIDT